MIDFLTYLAFLMLGSGLGFLSAALMCSAGRE